MAQARAIVCWCGSVDFVCVCVGCGAMGMYVWGWMDGCTFRYVFVYVSNMHVCVCGVRRGGGIWCVRSYQIDPGVRGCDSGLQV